MHSKQGFHAIEGRYLEQQVKVLVVGAGGTGSHVVSDLAVLHMSMIALGHPGGLRVDLMDFDKVTSANVGRARFLPGDVGQNKAAVLVHRINMCFGLRFEAVQDRLDDSFAMRGYDIVIGCVDTRESRRAIHAAGRSSNAYWLDIGNDRDDGQVVLGQFPGTRYSFGEKSKVDRLPCVTDLYPELLDESKDPADPGPSCSMAEALLKQSLFVNKTAALHAVSLLSGLFRDGGLSHHAIFFNTKTGRSNSMSCDPKAWARFGYVAQGVEAAGSKATATDQEPALEEAGD